MMNDFGRVKIVRPCGKKVMLEFSKPNGRVVIKPFHVNRLKVVDVSVKQKVEDVKRYFANLLLTEVKKGATLSVKYLMKSFPNMIDPINSQFNDTSCIALNVACRKGNIEIVKLLLEHEESCTDEEDELEEFSVGPIHSSVYGYLISVYDDI
jgi:ankyrin repeat protein